jgi:spore coat protein U-like protein
MRLSRPVVRGRQLCALLGAALLAFACAGAGAADNASLAVSATIVAKGSCKFATGTVFSAVLRNNGTNIDPSSTTTASGTTSGSFDCKGGGNQPIVFVVSATDGLHASSPGLRRMQHATVTTEYLPYALAISPSSASVEKNTPVTVTITATAVAGDFQSVVAGSYSDTVTVSVSP